MKMAVGRGIDGRPRKTPASRVVEIFLGSVSVPEGNEE